MDEKTMVNDILEGTKGEMIVKSLKRNIVEGKEAELSYTEDDYGTSYYYRGAVDNNYLNFEEIFNILSGLFYHILQLGYDFNQNQKG